MTFWRDKPLEQMTDQEWESLCDGCGLCCRVLADEDAETSGRADDRACRLLDLSTHRCRDYANRQDRVPQCTKVTAGNVWALDWLPESCAYRRLARGLDLPRWHHLVCGDRERVHRLGISRRGRLVPEATPAQPPHRCVRSGLAEDTAGGRE
jgi:uncharacterized cysteine cluster protein YcgN (CxxCxxCC family)